MPKYAAVDIGSNSVRMEVAEIAPGGQNGGPPNVRIVASEREVTRLGEGVFRAGRVSPEAMALTLSVLARMARTILKLDLDGIRVVATSAIRDARNQREFLEGAAKAIGAPVEVISGAEEARLIHLGVQLRWPHPDKRILLIDIGGGSAELILSDRGALVEAFSKPLGAVRLNEMFLRTDPPAESELERMHEYIAQKLARPAERIGRVSIDRVIATAATASSIVSAIHRLGRDEKEQCDRRRATLRQVRKLNDQVSTRDLAARRRISGIGPRRAEIIIPGVAVLMRVLDTFRQPAFYYSGSGVREGIIADLYARRVGRELSMLSREQRQVIEQLSRRYGVELRHARKVAELSHLLFESTSALHGRPRECGKLLQAAALLRDVGHYVSDSRHHKHTYYLVANSALPGFTDRERDVIANLARYHRKSMPTALHAEFQALSVEDQDAVRKLAPLLRLADALDRSQKQLVSSVECRVNSDTVHLGLQTSGRVDLEVWAAEQNRELFRQTYGRNLVIARK